MNNIVRRVREAYRVHGFWGTLGALFLKMLRGFGFDLNINNCYRKNLAEPVGTEAGDGRVTAISVEDVERQAVLNPTWFTANKILRVKKMLQTEGNFGYGIFDGELLISYGIISTVWYCPGQRLKAEQGFLWDDYTHPDYRGRGLHGEIIRFREEKLRRRGKSRVGVLVHCFNRASRVAFLRAGYKAYSTIYRWSFAGGPVHTRVKRENMKD